MIFKDWCGNMMWCLLGYKMNKRVGGLTEFQFQPLTSSHSLNVTIAITGWLSETHQGIVSILSCYYTIFNAI